MLRILLVDEDSHFRTSLKTYLESEADCTICGEACDGVEAIDLTDTLRPDLIVMDFKMPKMNGLEAARALSDRKSGIPVVLFTGYNTVFDPDADGCRGIDTVISKDNAEFLVSHINRITRPGLQA